MKKSEWQQRIRELLAAGEWHDFIESGNVPELEPDDDESLNPDRLITQKELLEDYVPLSRTTLWRQVKKHKFPQPLRGIDSRLRWRFSVIQKWIQER